MSSYNKKTTHPVTESLEDYLARGGEVKRLRRGERNINNELDSSATNNNAARRDIERLHRLNNSKSFRIKK